jgi:hypothetical protein
LNNGLNALAKHSAKIPRVAGVADPKSIRLDQSHSLTWGSRPFPFLQHSVIEQVIFSWRK